MKFHKSKCNGHSKLSRHFISCVCILSFPSSSTKFAYCIFQHLRCCAPPHLFLTYKTDLLCLLLSLRTGVGLALTGVFLAFVGDTFLCSLNDAGSFRFFVKGRARFLPSALIRPLNCGWNKKIDTMTKGQCPNDSQKAVIIDVIESVGKIASKIWPVV